MKTLALSDGDLALGTRGYATVSGAAKLRQDLGVAIREPVGGDRFHPGWGSIMSNLVGSVIDSRSRLLVVTEATRILNNYIAVQQDLRKQDAAQGRPSRYSNGEIIKRVVSIDTTQSLDTLRVRIVLQTLNDERVTLNTQVRL